MEDKIPEIEKSIKDQILDRLASKLKDKSFGNSFLEELKNIDLTKPVAVKEVLTKSFEENEDSEAGH